MKRFLDYSLDNQDGIFPSWFGDNWDASFQIEYNREYDSGDRLCPPYLSIDIELAGDSLKIWDKSKPAGQQRVYLQGWQNHAVAFAIQCYLEQNHDSISEACETDYQDGLDFAREQRTER